LTRPAGKLQNYTLRTSVRRKSSTKRAATELVGRNRNITSHWSENFNNYRGTGITICGLTASSQRDIEGRHREEKPMNEKLQIRKSSGEGKR
jgi:hypothetical protein